MESTACLKGLRLPPPSLGVLDRPIKTRRPPRCLVADRHQPQRIGGMARPIMLRPEADIANVVLPFVVKPDRVATGFGRCLVPPDLRTQAPQRLDPHHDRAPALVLHRR